MKFTGKESGNKLERDLFAKLHDSVELAHLKVDSLMYFHVYGDLYMLAKSNDLGFSVLSMNQHYLELQTYLSELKMNPELAFDANYHVFRSEKRLYGEDKKVNHRLNSPKVYERLFQKSETDSDSVAALLLSKGVSKMRDKLCSYAQDQLPGGRYWDADQQVKDILRELRPSNDLCESILGLTDYLTTALPNLHQLARSNLVQAKKNKTLKWLSDLPDEEQLAVVDLAVQQRRQVTREYKKEEQLRAEQRRKHMIEANAKREAAQKKCRKEKEKLSQMHLITTSKELKEELLKINSEKISPAKKRNKKITLLQTQVKIRKKVLSQSVLITFSKNRRQRPVTDIMNELCEFIDKNVLPTECARFIKDLVALSKTQVH